MAYPLRNFRPQPAFRQRPSPQALPLQCSPRRLQEAFLCLSLPPHRPGPAATVVLLADAAAPLLEA